MWRLITLASIFLCCILPTFAQHIISFDNESSEHALIKLIGPTPTLIEVSDRTQESVPVSAGKYFIKVRYGQVTYHYARGQDFTIDESPGRTSTITITLHNVVNGNYESTPISAQEFGATANPEVDHKLDVSSNDQNIMDVVDIAGTTIRLVPKQAHLFAERARSHIFCEVA
jgi:hypothetical protein